MACSGNLALGFPVQAFGQIIQLVNNLSAGRFQITQQLESIIPVAFCVGLGDLLLGGDHRKPDTIAGSAHDAYTLAPLAGRDQCFI